MTRRHALGDDQWERIKDILPGQPHDVGVTAKDNRLFVEAVLYRYKTGIPWCDLPERFGDFILVLVVGQKKAYGSRPFISYLSNQMMNTP